jgi:FkbH-like protein
MPAAMDDEETSLLTLRDLKKNLSKDASSLPRVRLALLGDSATQLLATAIRGMGYEYGLAIEMFEAEFNQVERQLLDPSSELHAFEPDILVVFQATHKLAAKHSKLRPEQQADLAEERLRFIESVCQGREGKVICFNYPEMDDAVYGSFANRVETSFPYQLRKLNFELMRLAEKTPNLFLCDLAAIQNKVGRDALFAPAVYANTEMVISVDILPLVAARTMDIVAALQGRIRKCVVLDLDNTLWGGVIGDDGVERIQLGHGLGIGKIFVEFQLWLKKLKNRGIILAVCSKNTESVAKEPFEKHPDMVLRLDDIAVFRANWENKAENIREIQRILNIGFDSMVFLDDNPFERDIVRENVPGIVVPELPEDPAGYLEFLYSLNLFETASASSADAERTRQYQEQAKRDDLRQGFVDEAGYLRSLDMVSTIGGFDAFNTPRVAQLSQRSNQFNLRTVRYAEGDIERIGKDPRYRSFSFTLEDKFGDNGLICVVILEKNGSEELFVDTWFMSCRVLKRGMENFTLNTLVEYAASNGFKRIVGEYIPTEKNAMVKEHFPCLGFVPVPGEDGRILYAIDVDGFRPLECFISPKRGSVRT